ncbi:MAG: transposase, partial [Lentisphaeria bacterium]|nr:transposase [Lentisphaeria bacterium]
MARVARRHLPGCLYHIITRCIGHEFLLDDPFIRERALTLLEDSAKKSGALILGWCFMSSHYHLVIKAGAKPLEKLMKPLNTGLAGAVNRRRGRCGHVFAGRFKDIIVDEEEHLHELVRYIHNNPVRAKVVKRASESSWSS